MVRTSSSGLRRSLFILLSLAIILAACSIFLSAAHGQRWLLDYSAVSPGKPQYALPRWNSRRISEEVPLNSSAIVLGDEGGSRNYKVLKVYMYDLPAVFHFGLLGWEPKGEGDVWPDIRSAAPAHPGGLNLQHSVEYWLTLDLLSSRSADRRFSRGAVRVDNSSEADVIFVPFFSSLSYNRYSKVVPPQNVSRNKLLQEKLISFLVAREEWRRYGGRDHLIIAHHPNSLLDARSALRPATFVLADFGRYNLKDANLAKDLIAPYRHLVSTYVNDQAGYDQRTTLLYFRGAIHRKEGGNIRHVLYQLLKDEKGVHFTFGTVGEHGISKAGHGMRESKFCLNIAGDTPSSNRLFDAVASHCVPVIISDDIELPYEDVLDYSEFCIFVRSADAVKKGFLMNRLRSIGKQEWTRMWQRLKDVDKHFEYDYPSKEDDAVQMLWKALARKLPAIRQKVHKFIRFGRAA